MTKIDMEFNKNTDAMQLLVAKMNHRLEAIHLGGGKQRIEKEHGKGKLTARERVGYLIDDGSEFTEIGAFVGYEMYAEHGGCPPSYAR